MRLGMRRISEQQRQWFYNVGLPAIYLKLGEDTLKLAKKMAPVNTGQLKDSGKVLAGNKGFKIHFTAPYSYQVHQGKAQPLSSPYVMNTPAHFRRTSKGNVRIKAHTKTFKSGYKPVRSKYSDSGWYTRDVSNEPPSQPFLQTAWKQVYSKQPREIKKLLPKTLSITEIIV